MIERLTSQGNVEVCALCDLRAGDVFRAIDGNGASPWFEAVADPHQEPHPTRPGESVWGIANIPLAALPCA